MAVFDDSTLWRISALERANAAGDGAGTGSAPLSTTLLADLRRLQTDPHEDDVLAAVAACVRHRQAALLLFEHGPWLWPLTILPEQRLYHAAHDVAELRTLATLSKLKLFGAEPARVKAPTFAQQSDAAAMARYRPLTPLLSALALHGARSTLLADIGGRAAYRMTPGSTEMLADATGALAPVVQRLRALAAPLRDIARWPGMSLERASRLLNALYLTGGLIVSRAHPAARSEPTATPGR